MTIEKRGESIEPLETQVLLAETDGTTRPLTELECREMLLDQCLQFGIPGEHSNLSQADLGNELTVGLARDPVATAIIVAATEICSRLDRLLVHLGEEVPDYSRSKRGG